jgi:hypothetical protein
MFTKKQKEELVQKRGAIITFKGPVFQGATMGKQIIVERFEKDKDSDEVRIIGPFFNTTWFDDMKDLLDHVDWKSMWESYSYDSGIKRRDIMDFGEDLYGAKPKDQLTVKNYFQQYEKLGILQRHPIVKQFHDFFADATDSGKNWKNYQTEEHTRKVIDQYIEKVNKILAAEAQRTPASAKKENSKPAPKSAVKKVITKSVVKKPEPVKSKAKPQKSKGEKKVLRLNKGRMVEMIDPHLLVIARYMRMNGKVRTHRAIENFFSQINKAAESKILRKASPYANLVVYIQKQLLGYLEREKDEYKIDIPTAKYEAMQKTVAKEQQMASVRLLKRYHGMAGRTTTIDKAKRLYNEIYKAIEAGNIPSGDRLYKRVVKVMKDLNSYVEKADESDSLERLPVELSGLLGFMDGCLCKQDQQLNGVESPDEVEFGFFGEGGADGLTGPAFPDPKTPVPSTELRNFHFERLPIEEPWVWLFGELTEGSTTMVKGDEKTGKSILMICFARYLAENFGKVLYITSEEGWSATTQNKFDETNTYHPDLEIVAEMPDDIDKFKFVIYDSVSKMKLSAEEFFNLKKEYPNKCFFGIFHLTHGGQQRGSREFSYDVDNIVNVIRDGIAIARGRLLGTKKEEVDFFEFCL